MKRSEIKKSVEDFGGQSITVTVGGARLSPIQYSSFEVGPQSLTVTVAPGESVDDAYRRARAVLTRIQREELQTALDEFLWMTKEAVRQTKARR